MKKILLFTITTLLLSNDNFDNSFITKYEYGKMLYNNPRGISCNKCHGDDAKGKVIAKFKHHFNEKTYNCEIKSVNITNVTLELFQATLNPKIEKPKRKFNKTEICQKLTYQNSMPKYFLTDEELSSIYFYITHLTDHE